MICFISMICFIFRRVLTTDGWFVWNQFVIVGPTATLGSVVDALNAYTDRRTGDSGVVIVAEDKGKLEKTSLVSFFGFMPCL